MTRRQLLSGTAGTLLLGCSGPDGFVATDAGSPSDAGPDAPRPPSDAGSEVDAPVGCGDPFAGGVLLGTVPFTGEGGPLETATGEGLNGRLYTDLSKLQPGDLVTSASAHYIRTRTPDLLDTTGWKIAASGLVRTPIDLTLAMLAPKVQRDLGPFVMECSGNGAFASFGMLSASRWSGVPIDDVLAMIDVLPAAKRVLVSGFDSYSQPQPGISTPGASWIFTFAQLRDAGAFFATELNGAPLPLDHGFPVRLLVPNWYGCTCIKWVNEIQLVDDDAQATSQMREFASRTHQTGVPALARDYRAATMDQAAMPVRIEKWRVSGKIVYRVVGVMWGGYQVTDKLTIRFSSDEAFVPVDVCPKQMTNRTWTLFTHAWRPARIGSYAVRCAIADPSVPTKRLDSGFYQRSVTIDEVSV